MTGQVVSPSPEEVERVVEWHEVINSIGIIGAFLLGADQVRRAAREAAQRDEDRRTERALELHRDVVAEGETARSFHRLSVLLRRIGTERHGRTTWAMLSDQDFDEDGLLDARQLDREIAFQDLYQVLWFYERVDTALRYGLVNEEVLFRTIGFHTWWWSQLLRQVKGPKAAAPLRSLGPRAAKYAEAAGEYMTWQNRCAFDFGGAGPEMSSDDLVAGDQKTEVVSDQER